MVDNTIWKRFLDAASLALLRKELNFDEPEDLLVRVIVRQAESFVSLESDLQQAKAKADTYSKALDNYQERLNPLFDALDKAGVSIDSYDCVIKGAVDCITDLHTRLQAAEADIRALAAAEEEG